jgi:hypothetical protein
MDTCHLKIRLFVIFFTYFTIHEMLPFHKFDFSECLVVIFAERSREEDIRRSTIVGCDARNFHGFGDVI